MQWFCSLQGNEFFTEVLLAPPIQDRVHDGALGRQYAGYAPARAALQVGGRSEECAPEALGSKLWNALYAFPEVTWVQCFGSLQGSEFFTEVLPCPSN